MPGTDDFARPQPQQQSAVQWALLGLVIERPSYGYELATRFERAYNGELRLSSPSYAYVVLEALKDRELVEEVPGSGSDRQPKPIYRSTRLGMAAFEEHLVSEVGEDRRRFRVWTRKLTAFAREPEVGLALTGRIREACLKEALGSRSFSPRTEAQLDPAGRLAARLAAEEGRLAIEAMLSWLDYADRELNALAGRSSRK
jgi:DNA-binding PadR family transcriptional regulator